MYKRVSGTGIGQNHGCKCIVWHLASWCNAA